MPYVTKCVKTKKKSLTSSQIRAARALIRWTAEDLSRQSAVSLRTIRRAELAERDTSMTPANDLAVRRAWKMLALNSSMRMAEAQAYDCVTVRTPSNNLRRVLLCLAMLLAADNLRSSRDGACPTSANDSVLHPILRCTRQTCDPLVCRRGCFPSSETHVGLIVALLPPTRLKRPRCWLLKHGRRPSHLALPSTAQTPYRRRAAADLYSRTRTPHCERKDQSRFRPRRRLRPRPLAGSRC